MKILMVISGLNYGGGTERVSSLIANGLSQAGYEIVFATITHSDKPFFPLEKEIKVISLASFSENRLFRMPNTVYKIRKLLKRELIDTVIAVDTMCTLFTVPATLGLSINHIGWEHFNFNVNLGNKKRTRARQLAARYCDSIVTLTEKDKEYWLKGTNCKSQLISIANPCPFTVQEYTKEENTKIVLAVGRLDYQKGFDLLLEAWIQVNKTMPDWKLKIVGDGKEREKLPEFIKKNELTNSVELVGKSNNIDKYYREAEIFCLSSRFEGFPMVLLETLAFALPVVSFDCDTGPAEVLKDTGSILVAQNDIPQLSASLIELMNNEEQRNIISVRSKEKAKLYQLDKIVSQWVDLLESFE